MVWASGGRVVISEFFDNESSFHFFGGGCICVFSIN